MCCEGRPLASTPGTSPELMEPETSNPVSSLPPHRGLPRLHELSPAQPAPQGNMRIGTPVSCRRCRLTSVSAPGCGQGRVRRQVSSSAPWASDIIFWSGGGGSTGGSLEVLGREDTGRPWPGPQAWRSQQLGVPEAPSLGDLGPIFQSVEKYCKKNLRAGRTEE